MRALATYMCKPCRAYARSAWALLRDQPALRWVQVSGHVYTEEGKKVLALSGAWNGHLNMQPCDEEGDPLPGSQTTRLWQVRP